MLRRESKQIRQSLDATDAALAKRKLAAFKSDLEMIAPEVARRDLKRHREIYEQTIHVFFRYGETSLCLLAPNRKPRP